MALPPDDGFHWRIWAAEALGTALLVLAILLAASLAPAEGSPLAESLPGSGVRYMALGILVGPSVALIAVSPAGRLSGAHLNPAVTLGFWALGQVSRHDLAGYVAAQLLGALIGALAAALLLPGSATDSIGGGVTHPAAASTGAALALEAAMTALLLAVIFAFVCGERRARWTPAAVALTLVLLIWLGSPWTGASLNPARSEGPAVAFGDLADLWLYFAAPCAAALAIGYAGRRLSMRPRTAKLFHDPRFPCTLASSLPASPPSAAIRSVTPRAPAALLPMTPIEKE